jgi:hypothetical protein
MSEYDKDSEPVRRRTDLTGTTPRRNSSHPQPSAVPYFGLAAEPPWLPPPPPDPPPEPPIDAPPPIVAEAFPLWLAVAGCAPVEASLPAGREAAEKDEFPFGPDDAGRNVAGPWLAPRLPASIPPGAAAYTGMLTDPCFTTSFEILFRLPSDPLGTPSPAESF